MTEHSKIRTISNKNYIYYVIKRVGKNDLTRICRKPVILFYYFKKIFFKDIKNSAWTSTVKYLAVTHPFQPFLNM